MAQLIDIRKVTISPRSLTAEVRLSADAPLFTADDLEGTDRIIDLMPQMLDHACYGDGGETFGAVVDDTEIAHLLEHVTVEVLARTKRAGAISAGQTRELDARRRTETGDVAGVAGDFWFYEYDMQCYKPFLLLEAPSKRELAAKPTEGVSQDGRMQYAIVVYAGYVVASFDARISNNRVSIVPSL